MGEHLLKRIDIEVTDPIERGQVLQVLLRETTASLRKVDENGERDSQLVELEYFHHPKLSRKEMYKELHISRAQLHRYLTNHLPRAIEKLADLFIQNLSPAKVCLIF